MGQLKKGVLLNYVTIFLTNVIGLAMTPFILNHLGQNEYGIYLTVGALTGTISLLDFGLSNTVVRFVAKYRAKNDRKGEENFLATVLLIYNIIAVLVLFVGLILYTYLDSYFTKMTLEEIDVAKMMFVILIFNLTITLPGGIFTGICSGYEQFVFPKLVNIVRYLFRSLTVVGVFLLGGDAISLVIIDTVFNIAVIIATGYFVFNKLKVRFKLYFFNKKFIKEILTYSVWIFVFALVGIFQWKAGHWVLGNMSVPSVLAIYGIGITLGTYYGAFSTAISNVFLPRATQMSVANASGEELTNMMIRIGRLSLMVLMVILIAFILYGYQFVFLWVGSDLGADGSYQAWIIALLIMIAYTLPLIQNFGHSILQAKNKLAFKGILYLCFMVIGTMLGAVLAKKYEAKGMIIGSVTAWLMAQNVMNFYYHHIIKINVIRFFKELVNKLLPTLFVIWMAGYFINYIPGGGWMNFLMKGSLFITVAVVLIYMLGMLNNEKELIKKPFESMLKRK